ncbi:unnamed protein product [Rotaria sordida]|uniref:ATPase AAA-type core domain-containing protein n=1 Tax=Rotaria sordida TaxID=392033 RepID=A0A813MR83_9BILA|nr:unnamed protein product [Rotaria sordida]
MVGNAKDVKNIGLHSLLYLHDKVFSYIQILQEKRYNSSHPEIISSIEDKLIIEKDYHRLNQLFLHFFKAELKRDVEGNCTLYGQSIENVEFSEGQKILLQIIVAIHAQGGGINNYILILDEPENHLHPSAIIEILEILKANNTNGQIWIATHSIPILSHFGPEYIWYLEDGEVKHAGKVPQTVLEGLLGNEEEIEKLKDFVGLPELLALNTFAYECLLEPTVVTTEAGDPQTRQINTVLNSIIKNDGQEKLKVLDFGAGKGRLLSNLYEDMESAGQNLTDVLDYIAYDEYDADKTTCSDLIDKVYGSSDERYFNSIDKLISKQDKESFDVVILCNVLHEIEPQKWIELFSQKISKLLKENGVALIVEDTLMPVGEMAHSKGFIVLDTTQLKELFKVSSKEIDFVSNDAKGDDRLKAHYIGKRHLQNISTETLKESLKSAKKRASEKISKLRSSKEKSYKMGKAHAFYVQQYANADLALIELGG